MRGAAVVAVVIANVGCGAGATAPASPAGRLGADGTVRCWGWNVGGQVGDGTITNRLGLVEVPGRSSIAAIATGSYHSCAPGRDGSPLYHVCALRADGAIACWGSRSNGQLGDGTTDDRPVPVAVAGLWPG